MAFLRKKRKNQRGKIIMKHGKKFLAITSLCLGASIFSACSTPVNIVTFNEYWKKNADANTSVLEVLEYKISHEAESGLTDAYSVAYANGTYTTTLSLSNGNYHYETELEIQVTFTLGDKTETFTDKVISKIDFERAANNLRPIRSEKTIDNHTPLNVSEAFELSDCYANVHYTLETVYEDDLSEGTTKLTNHNAENAVQEKTFEINDKKARYLDNEQLYLAMRAVNPSSFSAPKILTYAPFTGVVQNINANFSSSDEGATFEFTRNDVPFKDVINYREVTLEIDAKNSGSTQTLWIATTQSGTNKNRNLILKIETPLSYGMGSLVYSLVSETYTEQ